MWHLRALLPSLSAAMLLQACGSARGRVVDTPHFSARFDQGWTAGLSDGGHAYLFRSADGRVDIQIYAWVVRDDVAQPETEALSRLQQVLLGAEAASGQGACGPSTVTLFGHPARVLDLQAAGGHALMAAAQAEGSLVAVVARGRTSSTCQDAQEVGAAMDRFIAGLSPGWHDLAMNPAHQPRRSFVPDGCARQPSMADCAQAWLSARFP
jgi:hypothetical protein